MISEMTKQAGLGLGERVKIAAAIVAIHNYDRTQQVLNLAGEVKVAALQKLGQDLSDEQAIEVALAGMDEESKAKNSLAGLLGRYKDFSANAINTAGRGISQGAQFALHNSPGEVAYNAVGRPVVDANKAVAQRLLAMLRGGQGADTAGME
jgi:hypothetical protein